MMNQVLDKDAATRLGGIRAVNPEKATAVENIIIGNAQSGKIQGKVSEDQLIDLLRQVSDVDASTSTVTYKK